MNQPIRRLALVVAAMFCSLLVASTIIQFFQADSLNERPGNRRTLLASYAKQRGAIIVGGQAVATSTATNDDLKWLRKYPQGKLYGALTGYDSFTYGTSGLENSYNDYLSGTSDKLFYRNIADVLTGSSPQGASLMLTVQAKVQQVAAEQLGNQRGAVVALDPKTGAILAMVTSPTYDPNQLSSHNLKSVENAWTSLTKNSQNPLVNRAINGNLYPPGSTFKLVTTAAALSSGKYTPDSVVPGPARMKLPQTTATLPTDDLRPCGPNDKTTLSHALAVSCNTSYASIGMALGQDELASQAKKFGFGQQINIPMTATASTFPTGLNQPQLAQSAIGQFDVRATPLQIAMISAGIANGGKVMQPYLVQSIRDEKLDTISTTDPKVFSTAVSASVASELTTMMEGVVTGGTGVNAQIQGVQVAGKTGTAEHGAGRNADVWFTGFAPANDPKVAVAVIVEDGGTQAQEASGASVAAPIARKVMQAALGQ